MATKISADIASIVDITARRNDSFYLKTTLTKSDGSIYNLSGTSDAQPYEAKLEVYDANDVKVLSFVSGTGSGVEVSNSVVVNVTTGELTVKVPATGMTIRTGVYKYKFFVNHTGDEETNTVMIGKFKVVDI